MVSSFMHLYSRHEFLLSWAIDNVFSKSKYSKDLKDLKKFLEIFKSKRNLGIDLGIEIHHTSKPVFEPTIYTCPDDIILDDKNNLFKKINNLRDLGYIDNSQLFDFDPKCFYEIDINNKRANFGGVFYTIKPKNLNFNKLDITIMMIRELSTISCINLPNQLSDKIKNIFEFIEIPIHIGLMSGRGNILKLVSRISPNNIKKLKTIYPKINQCSNFINNLELILSLKKYLADIFISFDWDVNNNQILERFGIELYFERCSQRSENIFKFLSVLRNNVSSYPQSLDDIIFSLPKGQKYRTMSDFNTKRLNYTINFSEISHLKIIFPKNENLCLLKSYLKFSSITKYKFIDPE